MNEDTEEAGQRPPLAETAMPALRTSLGEPPLLGWLLETIGVQRAAEMARSLSTFAAAC